MNSSHIENIDSITRRKNLKPEIGDTYKATLKFLIETELRGACHAISSIFYVLLTGKDLECKIVYGELGKDGKCFDHSWIEIDGNIYDIAIALTAYPTYDGAPVFSGESIGGGNSLTWNYGVSSQFSVDPAMLQVIETPFVEFMDNAPFHKNGLWHFVQKIGKKVGLKLSLNKMRKKYSDVKREIREPVSRHGEGH